MMRALDEGSDYASERLISLLELDMDVNDDPFESECDVRRLNDLLGSSVLPAAPAAVAVLPFAPACLLEVALVEEI